MNVKQVMKHFGVTTYKEVGAIVNATQPAVSNWVARGHIPELQQRRFAEKSGGVLKVSRKPKPRVKS